LGLREIVIGIIGFLSPADAASTVSLRVELEESGALAGVSIWTILMCGRCAARLAPRR